MANLGIFRVLARLDSLSFVFIEPSPDWWIKPHIRVSPDSKGETEYDSNSH